MLQPSLNVRYWKRMRPNKVYPIVVTCKGQNELPPVTLRLVMAGAQVVPAEQVMAVSNPGEKVTFYVTPLAKGSLRAERLEVIQDGRKIQELRLPCKVCTQRPTLVWLLLALVIPWVLLHFFVYSPIGYQTPIKGDGTLDYDKKAKDDYAKTGESEPRAARITNFVRDNTPELKPLVPKDFADTYDDVIYFPERAYLHMFRAHRALGQPLAFYVFVVCLVLALVSFIFRQERRKTVRGRPLPG